MTRSTISWLAAAALAATMTALPFSAAVAQNKGEVKIALIASKTGPLEAYAKQTIVGFNLGLDYATGGTMMVNGKKLVVIEKDDQGKPDVGKTLLAQAYADDKVDIAVGPTASPVALAMLPVAEEYKKILLVEPAVADSITGDKWNKYIFRTGRNSSQDAIANAVALDQAGTSIVTLAQDNAFGTALQADMTRFITEAGLNHEMVVTMMELPPGCSGAHEVDFYEKTLQGTPQRKARWKTCVACIDRSSLSSRQSSGKPASTRWTSAHRIQPIWRSICLTTRSRAQQPGPMRLGISKTSKAAQGQTPSPRAVV